MGVYMMNATIPTHDGRPGPEAPAFAALVGRQEDRVDAFSLHTGPKSGWRLGFRAGAPINCAPVHESESQLLGWRWRSFASKAAHCAGGPKHEVPPARHA